MTTVEILEELSRIAVKDEEIKDRFLETRKAESPLKAFCAIAAELGFPLSPMDIVEAGEDFHASMKRSTNGGGENSPMLSYQDDFYEMFFAVLTMKKETL